MVAAQKIRTQGSRDQILSCAAKLFASRGSHETSMADVAREAQVSKALIFWHFKSKEELLLAVLQRLFEPYFIDFAEEAGSLDEAAQLQRLIELYLVFVRDNASSLRFFLAQMLHRERQSEMIEGQVLQIYEGFRNLLTDLIFRGQEKGIFLKTYAPGRAAGYLMSALNGLLVEFLFSGSGEPDAQAAMAMVRGWLLAENVEAGSDDGEAVA